MDLNTLLLEFGLSENEVKVYLFLHKEGVSSAPQISKKLKMPKTNVYRSIENLLNQKFITELIEEHGKKYEIAPIENFQNVVAEQEIKLKHLQTNLPKIYDQLSQISETDSTRTKVKYYSGVEGLQQVTWNSSKAKDTIRIFEIKTMSAFLNFNFCELTRTEFVKNNVKIKELTNEISIPNWTDITQLVQNNYEVRYIDPSELTMGIEMLVYNDVFVMYNFQNDEIFCVEIYNEKLANMQKQVFDYIWSKGRRMKLLNEHGASELIFQQGLTR